MACTFDRFNVTIGKKEHAKIFAEIYNEALKDDLYWGKNSFISVDDFEEGCDEYHLHVQDEPLFNCIENGAQLEPVIIKFLETVTDADFSAEYECTFNNCGAIVITSYEYENGVLKIKTLTSENGAVYYCPECDFECYDEPLFSASDYEEGQEIFCPNCGAKFDLEIDVFIDEIEIGAEEE